MLQQCSDRFTLPLLLNAATTGTKIVKTMAVVYLDRLVEVCASRGAAGSAALQNNKEFPRLLKSIGSFASDAAVESRTHSKWSLIRLARIMGLEELDKSMSRSLPPAHYHTVAKLLGKGMDTLVLELMAAQRAQAAADAALSPTNSSSSMGSPPPSGTGSMRNRAASNAAGGGGGAFSVHMDALDSTGDSLGSSGGGVDSKRAPRRKATTGLSASPSFTPLKGGGDVGMDVAAGASEFGSGTSWSSVRSVAGRGANMFDLNASPTSGDGEFASPNSAPASSSATATPSVPRTAGAKRRPTMSASGGSAGGSSGGSGTFSAPAPSAADNERFNAVMTDLSSGDWRLRLGGLEKLTAFLSGSPGAAAFYAAKIFDQLAQRISDHHGKVNVAALQSLATILPLSRPFLPSVLGPFVPVLASHLASTSPVVRQLSQAGLEQLVEVLSTPRASFVRETQSALLAPLCQVALFDSVKVRPAVIQLLTSVLDLSAEHIAECGSSSSASGSMPVVTTYKSVLPVCYALVDDGGVHARSSEVRAALTRCAQTMYALVGAGLWDDKLCMQFHIAPTQVGKLRALLGV
jgi:hypothetical protein